MRRMGLFLFSRSETICAYQATFHFWTDLKCECRLQMRIFAGEYCDGDATIFLLKRCCLGYGRGGMECVVLQRLGEHIANALDRAAAADRRAQDAFDPELRLDNERMAESWRLLARSLQFVESLERFLIDSQRARGLLPPKAPDEE
jgi:hypothetical protein